MRGAVGDVAPRIPITLSPPLGLSGGQSPHSATRYHSKPPIRNFLRTWDALRLPLVWPDIPTSKHSRPHPAMLPPPASSLSDAPTASQGVKRVVWDEEARLFPHVGTAAQATLALLEWQRLCDYVGAFAQTVLGRRACSLHVPPATREESEILVQETRAVDALETEYAADLDFGGIQTREASAALRRASRGGLLTGGSLLAVASLVLGATKLQRAISTAAKDAEATGHDVLRPLLALFPPERAKGSSSKSPGGENHQADMMSTVEVAGAIGTVLQEDGTVRESASEEVKKAATRVRTLEGRLGGVLRSTASATVGSDVTEYGNRLCVAVPVSGGNNEKPPRGILLGTAPGGTAWYIEPSAAVTLNNERAAAKAELTGAEEAVLWRLTGLVADGVESLEAALNSIVWLDAVAARARYGRWLGGTLPMFVDFPKTGRNRRGRGPARERVQGRDNRNDSGIVTKAADDDVQGVFQEEGKYLVRLRRLRHPLMLSDYLMAVQQQGGGSSGNLQVDLPSAPGGGRKVRRRLPGWKSRNSSGTGPPLVESSSSDEDVRGASSGSETESSFSNLEPPIPVDILIQSSTRVVVITGPNTGGKTASLKALGLTALAARAGIPIPASDPALLPCFDAVLADIGDEQSLSANLSTFSGHLKRIEALRRESSGKSLVLLDELGTGTDPVEGAALGATILQAMSAGGRGGAALTMATTHHGFLTTLKYGGVDGAMRDEGEGSMSSTAWTENNASGVFENASMEFDEVKLAPTYRLLWGVPGRSNALNIAERLGLDRDVVEAARGRLGVDTAAINETIAELEGLRRQIDADEDAAEMAEASAKAAMAEAEQLRRLIATKAAEIEVNAAREVAMVTRIARGELAQLKRMRAVENEKAGKSRGPSSDTAAMLSGASSVPKGKANTEQYTPDVWIPSQGDSVFIPRLNKNAKVIGIDSVGNLTLQAGLLKITATVGEVRRRQ